jgi:hemerythrin-like domain-containing protein
MEHRAIEEQVMIEHETLAHVVSALRTTVSWKITGSDISRKLSSLRFVAESFDRHLRRLLELEEADGYMKVVITERPEMTDTVRALRSEHVEFRTAVKDLLNRLHKVEPTDLRSFAVISDDLSGLLDKLDEHHHKEQGLLQEALLQDEGGEG